MLLVLNQNIQLKSLIRDASDRIKLKNLFDVFLNVTPSIPPSVVPNVPKNNPISVVFNKYPIKSPFIKIIIITRLC